LKKAERHNEGKSEHLTGITEETVYISVILDRSLAKIKTCDAM
jgi:hypothetical protein